MIIFTLIDVTKIDRNGRETMFGYKIIYTTRDVIIIQSGIDQSRKNTCESHLTFTDLLKSINVCNVSHRNQ